MFRCLGGGGAARTTLRRWRSSSPRVSQALDTATSLPAKGRRSARPRRTASSVSIPMYTGVALLMPPSCHTRARAVQLQTVHPMYVHVHLCACASMYPGPGHRTQRTSSIVRSRPNSLRRCLPSSRGEEKSSLHSPTVFLRRPEDPPLRVLRSEPLASGATLLRLPLGVVAVQGQGGAGRGGVEGVDRSIGRSLVWSTANPNKNRGLF